ncbi:MAG TPA: hypothetical protein VN841_25355 [Bryobacteraceae bacterium]|nr:hypothetical protein [Bryobacteraceae bacterium]
MARVYGLEEQGPSLVDDEHDVNIAVHIDFIQKLIRVSRLIRVLQHLNQLSTLNQSDDLVETDPTLPEEPGVLLGIEGVVPF